MMNLVKLIGTAALGAVVMTSTPALAGPPHCPPGHAKKGWCSPDGARSYRDRDHYRDRDRDRYRYERELERSYDEGYRDGRRDAYRMGDYIPRSRYSVIDDWRDRGWNYPGDGRYYVRVDDEIYLISAATGLVLDLLGR